MSFPATVIVTNPTGSKKLPADLHGTPDFLFLASHKYVSVVMAWEPTEFEEEACIFQELLAVNNARVELSLSKDRNK